MTTRELPAFRGRRVLMLGTTCVDRSVARQRWSRLLSVFPVLMMLLSRPWASIYVVARTASPRVLGIMASLFDGYPRPLHETPADLLDVGAHVAEATCPGAAYDREAMILRDVLANDPGAQIGEQYRDPLYNAYCADLLGPTDSFVLTSRLGLGKLCRALWRHVIRPARRTVKDR
jgi:hypothetical protein